MPSQDFERLQAAIRAISRTCDSLQAQFVQKLKLITQKREALEGRVAVLEQRLADLQVSVSAAIKDLENTIAKRKK